jgi:uncharacterized protein YcgI (DUF1989 family)
VTAIDDGGLSNVTTITVLSLVPTSVTNMLATGVTNLDPNFEAALRPFGIPLKEVPYSFNIFMNVPIGDGKIGIAEPVSKAGDYVDLGGTDLLVAISNCPQERNPATRTPDPAAGPLRSPGVRRGGSLPDPGERCPRAPPPVRTSTERRPPRLRRPPRPGPTIVFWAGTRPT